MPPKHLPRISFEREVLLEDKFGMIVMESEVGKKLAAGGNGKSLVDGICEHSRPLYLCSHPHCEPEYWKARERVNELSHILELHALVEHSPESSRIQSNRHAEKSDSQHRGEFGFGESFNAAMSPPGQG
jgi:hypothetical protein